MYAPESQVVDAGRILDGLFPLIELSYDDPGFRNRGFAVVMELGPDSFKSGAGLTGHLIPGPTSLVGPAEIVFQSCEEMGLGPYIGAWTDEAKEQLGICLPFNVMGAAHMARMKQRAAGHRNAMQQQPHDPAIDAERRRQQMFPHDQEP